MPELTLEKFAEESKGLFGGLMEKVKALGGDTDAIRTAFDAFKAEQASLKDEVADIATKMNRLPADGKTDAEKAEGEYKAAFNGYLRKGDDRMAPEQLKVLSTNPDSEGGYLMPRNLSTEILAAASQFAPIRALARIITISQGDSFEQPTLEGTMGVGRVGEKTARTDTSTHTFGKITIPTHEYYAQPPITQKMVDDVAVNVESFIQEKVGGAFDTLVADDYVEGDGINKPVGFTTKVTASVLSGTAGVITLAGMNKLYTKVKPAYRKNGTYAMNGATLASLLALAAASQQPLLMPNVQTGDGLKYLGKPIIEMSELPDEGAGNYPVYFGDFQRGYWIVDRQGMRVLRDPYTSKPYILLYTTWRTGGDCVMPEALAKMKSNNA